MNRVPMFLLALGSIQFLTACDKTVQVERVPVPERWLSCKDQPAPPAGNTDTDVATFILSLIEAGDDCRNNVKAIKEWDDGR